MAALIDQAQLEDRAGGPAELTRLTDDDRDGAADAAVIDRIADEASDIARGILLQGFPTEDQIDALVVNDTAVAGAICDIGLGLAGARRPQFYGTDGKPLYWYVREKAERLLRDVASAQRRSGAEANGAGQNAMIANQTTAEDPPRFVFSGNRQSRKDPGGF